MSQFVLDASAVLALLSREKGWEEVEQAIAMGAAISTVNVAEVVSKLSDTGMPETAIGQVLDLLGLDLDTEPLLLYQQWTVASSMGEGRTPALLRRGVSDLL